MLIDRPVGVDHESSRFADGRFSLSSQDRTLDHYQELMTINATAHVLRAGRELGVLSALAESQRTLEQLSESLKLPAPRLKLFMQTLRAIGIVEKYGEDFALSSTARLLCQYDRDLGDDLWSQLSTTIRTAEVDPGESAPIPRERFDSLAATQWVHTPAAMQAAEILNTIDQPALTDSTPRDVEGDVAGEGRADESQVGGSQAETPPATSQTKRLLDLGCGSGVWSCAIAHRDPALHVTAVDSPAAIQAAKTTAASIDLDNRFETRPGGLLDAELESTHYDYVLIAQQLHSLVPAQIDQVLSRAVAAVKPGGRVIVIDAYSANHQPTLAESLEALRLAIETPAAAVPELKVAEDRMRRAGLDELQFTYIAASRIGLGMMVGVKP